MLKNNFLRPGHIDGGTRFYLHHRCKSDRATVSVQRNMSIQVLTALFSNECIVCDYLAENTFLSCRIITSHLFGHVRIWNYDTQASYCVLRSILQVSTYGVSLDCQTSGKTYV
jgi:hypothetical protein